MSADLTIEVSNLDYFIDVTLGSTFQFKLKSYTVVGVPSGAAGDMIYVSNEIGGAVPAFHDGTNWRRCTDRNIVS